MKKWSISLIMLIAISCNKTSPIDPIPEVKQICNDTSVFEFSNAEVPIVGSGLKYTYNPTGEIIGLDEGKTPNHSYNFKYDKSSLTLLRTFLPTKYVEPFTLHLNEINSIKSYEGKKDDDTSIKGLYEYDSDNRLIKFSVTYASIKSPQYAQTHSFVIDWKDGNINEIRKYFNIYNQGDNFEWKKTFEYQGVENTDTDNFYNLIIFGNRTGINFEGYIGLDNIGIRKGIMPKILPTKYKYFSNSGDDAGSGEYSYKFDKYKRITNVKISGVSSLAYFSFNYLCH
jgi:hypothetical protein